MGVLGPVNIGGALRNLTGEGYVNIGGVLRPITIGNYNIGGVLLAGGYTWKKYNTVVTTTYVEKQGDVNVPLTLKFTSSNGGTKYTFGKTKKFSTADGTFSLTNTASYSPPNYWSNMKTYPYYLQDGKCYKMTSYNSNATNLGNGISGFKFYATEFYAEAVTSYSRGTYIEDVTSPDASAFPENGRHTDGYWYVKQ